jgi:uncharacterized protein
MDNSSVKSLYKNTISVTVAYSPAPREVVEKVLVLPIHSNVLDALKFVNLADDDHFTLGIWGKKTTLNHVLQNSDRLELYRPLKVDPKASRRERFQKQGARTTGLFARVRVGGKAGY